mgnify:FL=1
MVATRSTHNSHSAPTHTIPPTEIETAISPQVQNFSHRNSRRPCVSEASQPSSTTAMGGAHGVSATPGILSTARPQVGAPPLPA